MLVKEPSIPSIDSLVEEFGKEYVRAILVDKVKDPIYSHAYYSFLITPDWHTKGSIIKNDFVYFELSNISLLKTELFSGSVEFKQYTPKEQYAVINAPFHIFFWSFQCNQLLPKKASWHFPEALLSFKQLNEFVTRAYLIKNNKIELEKTIQEFYSWIDQYFQDVSYAKLAKMNFLNLPASERRRFIYDPFKTLPFRYTL
ncbi:hypothetical protein HYV79_04810 [Candidatus Woesearchaeota archaeon]|nr:hypothetical protein [Candidatus Woesearchaeota archaeon]